ncbi:hypothetical protein LguiB_001389 [Lonicera macranthoides]
MLFFGNTKYFQQFLNFRSPPPPPPPLLNFRSPPSPPPPPPPSGLVMGVVVVVIDGLELVSGENESVYCFF